MISMATERVSIDEDICKVVRKLSETRNNALRISFELLKFRIGDIIDMMKGLGWFFFAIDNVFSRQYHKPARYWSEILTSAYNFNYFDGYKKPTYLQLSPNLLCQLQKACHEIVVSFHL